MEREILKKAAAYLAKESLPGATVIEGVGMGQYISSKPMVAGIEEITGDLNSSQQALIISLEIAFTKGTMKMM